MHGVNKYENVLSLQTKEIQALQARMQASHESHALEVQTLQTQLCQLQDVVASSSMGNLQRLQEVNYKVTLHLHTFILFLTDLSPLPTYLITIVIVPIFHF